MNTSGRPSPFTSATATPVYQPEAVIPAARAPSVNVPWPLLPEQLDPVRGRHDQVRPAIAVQIRRGAPVALPLEPGMGARGHVAETAMEVLEQLGARQPFVRLPPQSVTARIRVDGEQVLPTVAVVVEPADSAAHHRRVVVRDPVAERALAEVEADRGGDVGQVDAVERGALGRGLDRNRPHGTGKRPVLVRGLMQVVRHPRTLHRRRWWALLGALHEPDPKRPPPPDRFAAGRSCAMKFGGVSVELRLHAVCGQDRDRRQAPGRHCA